MTHFKKLIVSQYNERSLVNDGRFFFNELFKAISLPKLGNNVSLYLIFIEAIASVDLGPKQRKSILIARDLLSIPPTEDVFDWELLERIIVWISKSLPSQDSALTGFRTLIFDWVVVDEPVYIISALNMASLFLRRFPNELVTCMEKINSAVLKALQHKDATVRAAGCKTLQAALTLSGTPNEKQVQSLCVTIFKSLLSSKGPQIKGFVEAVRSVIDAAPQFASVFTFVDPPLHLIEVDKPTEASLQLVYLAYRCTPRLFEYKHLSEMLKIYKKLVKKVSLRVTALKTLGEFAFLAAPRLHILLEEAVNDLIQIIYNDQLTSESAFALLSLINPHDQQYQKIMVKIFNMELDPLIVDGFAKFADLWKDYAADVRKELYKKLDDGIKSNEPSKIIISLRAFQDLKYSTEEIKKINNLLYAKLLLHPSLEVREKTVDFILYIKDSMPENIERLMVLAVSETDDKLKLRILNNVNLENTGTAYISLLISLAHDQNIEVCLSAIKILCSIECAQEAVQEVARELLEHLKLQSTIDKSDILMMNKIVDCSKFKIECSEEFIDCILQFPNITAGSAYLIKKLVLRGTKVNNYQLLINHVKANINLHSSMNRITAALTLLLTVINETDILDIIWESDLSILTMIFELSLKIEDAHTKSVILSIITKLGIIDPKIVQPLLNANRDHDNNPANTFRPLAENVDVSVSLTYASVSTALPLLMEIIDNDALVSLHSTAINALIKVIKSYNYIGDDLATILVANIKSFLTNGGPSTISTILRNFDSFLNGFGTKFANEVVPATVDVICNNWGRLQTSTLLRTIECLAIQQPKAFKPHVFRITKLLIEAIPTVSPDTVNEIFSVFVCFGNLFSDVDYLIIPVFLQYIDTHIECQQIGEILVKLKNVIAYINGNGIFFNEIIKTLLRVYQKNPDVRTYTLSAIMTLIVRFQNNAAFLLQEITHVINTESDKYFLKIISYLNEGEPIPHAIAEKFEHSTYESQFRQPNRNFSMRKRQEAREELNFEIPSENWAVEEWEKWYDENIPLFIKMSPSDAISACYPLANSHTHICTSLFPVAFAIYLTEEGTNSPFVELLNTVVKSKNVPLGILRLFLSSVELLEISGASPIIPFSLLAKFSYEARQYHQALRYAEEAFRMSPTSVSKLLIKVNQNLGLKEAANGVLRFLSSDKEEQDLSCNTYQFLGIWEDALRNYEKRLEEQPELLFNKMMCLEHLSRFNDLGETAKGVDERFSAVAAWGLGRVDEFMEHMANVPCNTDTYFYHAINSVLKKDLDIAKSFIDLTLKNSVELTFPVFTGDFECSYHNFAQATLITELSEVIELMENENKKERIMKNWNFRINQFSENEQAEYYDLLQIRSIYFSESEMIFLWKEFLNRTVKLGENQISQIVLKKLNPEDPETVFIKAMLAYYSGNIDEMIKGSEESLKATEYGSDLYIKISEMLGSVYIGTNQIDKATEHLKHAKDLSPDSYTVWQKWSKVMWLSYKEDGSKDPKYLNESLIALLNALALDPPIAAHFILKVFSILFNNGNTELYNTFRENMHRISPQNIAENMLQLIAKLGSDKELDELLTETIIYIGEDHPNVILQSIAGDYPYQKDKRKTIGYIVDLLKEKHPQLVKDSCLCRTELIKVAYLITEQWCHALEKALKSRKNEKAAAQQLLAIHKEMDREAESFIEVSFKAEFAGILAKAERLTKEFLENSNDNAFKLACMFYNTVYTKLAKAIKYNRMIALEKASPLLAHFSSEYVSVPGTYHFNKPLVTVSSIIPEIPVFMSKQKPRCITTIGSDGKKYKFLLKANEDPRLNQRVMQFLTFVNTLIGATKNCEITTYLILPLAPNVGLIGWVTDCTTIFDQVKKYRNMRNISSSKEHDTILSRAPNFEDLPIDEKENVFKYCLENTEVNDLKKILLINASDSSNWVSRRILFTNSLAVTSIVGYILGLGDRHLENIMMGNKTAKIVHIDFGDCFEVAQHRTVYPETVPFRLTRLFTNALEVSGVQGSFRQYSIDIMKLLRENKDPICGLFETFVYDPHLNLGSSGKMHSENKNTQNLVKRVADKLNGNDFSDKGHLAIDQQVDTLISEATSTRNLCTMYRGWQPWW